MNRGLARLLVVILAMLASPAEAARESKVSQTKHNLSSSGVGTVKSASETQICVFCHTPHGADASQPAPLWNKSIQTKTYTPYTSSSFDAATIQGASAGQPLGSSKLCLSCHDGAMQLGAVRVLRGQQDQVIPVDNTAAGAMPAGAGTATGFTRQLGGAGFDDLTNDHPISVTYDSTLSLRDGELRTPDAGQRWGNVFGKRVPGDGYKPMLPLEPTGAANAGQVQCTTCHDPHIRETDLTNEKNIKFLRANRFQFLPPTDTYSASNDIICLSCHDKGMQGDGKSWAYSAHANSLVATQTYKSGAGSAAEIREFPDNLPVWKAACLNCHDTHTVSGARRLLREGTDAIAVGGIKSGGNPALEQVCYQCHRDGAGAVLNTVTTVPNIKDDFELANGYRMPITSADQAAGQEVHDIGGNFNDGFAGSGTSGSDCSTPGNKCGADFIERRSQLGVGAPGNRHAECTDCHNPHRVVKFRLFSGNGGNIAGAGDAAGTHGHTDTIMTHTNVASGVLRGTWGVEPSYAGNSFNSGASNYTVRRGDPGNDSVPNDSNPDNKSYLTREYQVCLKCHSTYGYTTPPLLNGAGDRKGLTASGTNGLTQYTDQAKEFHAPDGHQGGSADGDQNGGNEFTLNAGADGGAGTAYNNNNHRSWHPVMRVTGRTLAKRGITGNPPWYRPWSSAVGGQTMYCTDCHGTATTGTGRKYDGSNAPAGDGTVIPNGGEDGKPWGPHGSANAFLLKGVWDKDAGATGRDSGYTGNFLCFNCHDADVYTTRSDSGKRTGFYDGTRGKGNLHNYHIDKIQRLQCTWCHVAVPHGWKNKALLVNLNDVGQEAGEGAGASREVRINDNNDYYTKEPYYLEAKLKIRAFSPSGSWDYNNCGSANKTGANLIPSTNGNASSNRTDNNVNWMKAVCNSPP
jgi:hypothetical protein